MRLLLDECVTRYVKRDLAEHDVMTIEEAGLKGLKNGVLLRHIAGRFDVLITVDKNIPYQQNTGELSVAILMLLAKSNAYAHLSPLMPQTLEALKQIKQGDIIRIGGVT